MEFNPAEVEHQYVSVPIPGNSPVVDILGEDCEAVKAWARVHLQQALMELSAKINADLGRERLYGNPDAEPVGLLGSIEVT
jgi:hypothetical protein